jgi:hypothetical protein
MKKFVFLLLVWILGSGCSPKLRTTTNQNYYDLDENYFSVSTNLSQRSVNFQTIEYTILRNQVWLRDDEFSIMYPNLFLPSYSWYSWNLRYIFFHPNTFYFYPRYQYWNYHWGWYSPGFYSNYYSWGWNWGRYPGLNRSYWYSDFGLRRAGPRFDNLNSPIYSWGRTQSGTTRPSRSNRLFRTRPTTDRNFSVKETQVERRIISNPQNSIIRDRSRVSDYPRQSYPTNRTEPEIKKERNFKNFSTPSYETSPKRNINSYSTPRPYVPTTRGYISSPRTPEISNPRQIPNSSPRPTYVPRRTQVYPPVRSTPSPAYSTPRSSVPHGRIIKE